MPRFLERSRRVKDFRHETKPITGNNFSRSRFSRTESSISRCCSYDKRRRLFFSTFHKFARSNCDKPWQAFAIITSGSRRRIFHGSRIACLIFHSQMRSKKRRRQKKKKKEGRKRTRNIGKKGKGLETRKKRKVYHRGKRKRFTMQRDSLISCVVRYVSVTDVHTGICTPIEFRFYAF